MAIKIYVDVLIVVNFIINLFTLKIIKKIFNSNTTEKRIYISAIIGGVLTLLIFIPIDNILINLLVKLAINIAIIKIGFNINRISLLLRYTFALFVIDIVFMGVAICLNSIFPNIFFTFSNGAIYLNIPPILLFICVVASYIIISIFDKLIDNGNIKNSSITAIIYRNGLSVRLDCYFDTGSTLTECFSGLPVMIAEYKYISILLNENERLCINNSRDPVITLRPIFYQTIDGDSMIYAFKPDKLELNIDKKTKIIDGYVAVNTKKLSCNGCNAIVGHNFIGSLNL